MAPETAKRETSGTVVRGLLEELRSRGLFDSVRAGVSPEARAMMDDPPLHITWVPSERHEELLVRLGEIAGREKVREIVYAFMRSAVGPLVAPLVKTYFRLFGASPVSVLKNLGKVAYLLYRGMQLEYEPQTARGGFVTLRHPEPVGDSVYAGWEGALAFGKDLTGEPAFEVGRFELFENGEAGRAHVQW